MVNIRQTNGSTIFSLNDKYPNLIEKKLNETHLLIDMIQKVEEIKIDDDDLKTPKYLEVVF